jgi:peptide deformylase
MENNIYTERNERMGLVLNNHAPKLSLVQYPSSYLITSSDPVTLMTTEILDFCYDLFDLYQWLAKRLGRAVVGLAAPQVGRNIRVFIVMGEIYVNPQITWLPNAGDKTELEGCLSLPAGKAYEVTRPYSLRLKWMDLQGNIKEEKIGSLRGRAILHEMDHLDGKLCCGKDFPTL